MCTRETPCSLIHHSASCTGNVAGCGRSFSATLNRFVRNKPRVAATAEIASRVCATSARCCFVLIWNAKARVDRCSTPPDFREMKNVFVAVVQKTFRVDRFEMAVRANIAIAIFNRDRFDPVNGVLQHEQIAQRSCRSSCGSIGLDGAEPTFRKERASQASESAGSAPTSRGTS